MIEYLRENREEIKMKRQRKKHIFIFLILNVGILTLSLIYNFLFSKGLVGDCVFLNTVGIYCPGCGGSRSLNALINLKIIRSFIYYPTIPITALILLYVDLRIFISIVKNQKKIKGINYRLFLIRPVFALSCRG